MQSCLYRNLFPSSPHPVYQSQNFASSFDASELLRNKEMAVMTQLLAQNGIYFKCPYGHIPHKRVRTSQNVRNLCEGPLVISQTFSMNLFVAYLYLQYEVSPAL